MKEFINHAEHNERFHQNLIDLSPSEYSDWKIICLFYIAVHYLKALSKHRGKDIGESHRDVNYNIGNIDRYGKPTMTITSTARSNYMNLYRYSQSARYDGCLDFEVFKEVNDSNYQHSLRCFEQFKSFIKTSGVEIN